MKLVYVAGPYRAPNEWQVVQNIRRAEALALEVWLMGAACICPHKNTALFGGATADEVWLEGDFEIVRRCDALLCTSDWQLSAGAVKEVELARSLKLPVFFTIDELQTWIQSDPDHRPVKRKA